MNAKTMNTATHTPTPLRAQIAEVLARLGRLGNQPLPNPPKLSTSTISSHIRPVRTSRVLSELRRMERDGVVQCLGRTQDVCPSWRSRGSVDDGELIWCEVRAALAKAGAA